MKANQKFVEADEAVSPVIGVILMVAITVVLAAVVFVLVSDLGGDSGAGSFPSAQAEDAGGDTTYAVGTDDLVTLEHRGGDPVQVADYTFKVNDVEVGVETYASGACTGTAATSWSVGQTICLVEDGTNDAVSADGSYTVQAIHKDSSTIVYETNVAIT